MTPPNDIALAAELLAVDPHRLGGVWLHGASGPVRDRVGLELGAAQDHPMLRLPAHITEDRLLGGLALAETLNAGRAVVQQGLLAEADGGILWVPMAERLEPQTVQPLCAALDRGQTALERDGLSRSYSSRFGVIALDEAVGDEARAPDELRDRLAFWIDLADADRGTLIELKKAALAEGPEPVRRDPAQQQRIAASRERLRTVEVDTRALAALCEAAGALGVESLRAMTLAGRAAQVHAALRGSDEVEDADVLVAARLVLGPRATRIPVPEEAENEMPPEAAPSPAEDEAPPADGEGESDSSRSQPSEPLQDRVVEAAESGIPSGLLDRLRSGRSHARSARFTGRARGAHKASSEKGRPAGVRAARPGRDVRLNVVETLRAAAPWQRLRRGTNRVQVRPEDFRVTRYRDREQTCVVFVVDASGSAAMQRLGEAKGAVERVLGDCYARRDQVALIAFRRDGAELVVPPTRSLTRARRCLSGLVGGGTTPLASGLDAARRLAEDLRRKGRTPIVVLMTDGRANVTRDGDKDPARAATDARDSAKALAGLGTPTLFLDTAPRPRPRAQALALEMNATYLPLPYLNAAALSQTVFSIAKQAS
ncbi:MAG: magnesium chelatase subunit D [Myxococcota bacterium]